MILCVYIWFELGGFFCFEVLSWVFGCVSLLLIVCCLFLFLNLWFGLMLWIATCLVDLWGVVGY